MKRNKKNFLTFRSGDLNPRFSVIFPPMIWIFMESEKPEIKSKQASKRDRTLSMFFSQHRDASVKAITYYFCRDYELSLWIIHSSKIYYTTKFFWDLSQFSNYHVLGLICSILVHLVQAWEWLYSCIVKSTQTN